MKGGNIMKGFWAASDTHFFHEKVIEYTNRPFDTIEEMNNKIIENWNRVISPEDTIYHLGDFAMGKENVAELVNMLNGKIILILGNHDRKGKQWFRNQGFYEVYNKLELGKLLLTHRPVVEDLPKDMINIHGHLHGRDIGLDLNRYVDVSCENTNYSPIWIDKS